MYSISNFNKIDIFDLFLVYLPVLLEPVLLYLSTMYFYTNVTQKPSWCIPMPSTIVSSFI